MRREGVARAGLGAPEGGDGCPPPPPPGARDSIVPSGSGVPTTMALGGFAAINTGDGDPRSGATAAWAKEAAEARLKSRVQEALTLARVRRGADGSLRWN